MKKAKLFIFITTFILLITGCQKAKDDNYLMVYSFSGENEQFSISNGVIVLSDTNDVFYGGDLEVTDKFPSEITSFSNTFYIMSGNEKKTISSNSVIDMTGGSIHINGDLGKLSGDGIIFVNGVDKLENLKNNLYFELVTTDKNGEKSVYQLQMSVTEVTKEIDE